MSLQFLLVFWRRPELMVGLGLIFFVFTYQKIENTKIVLGHLPGRTFVEAKVTKKYSEKHKGKTYHYLAFNKRLDHGFNFVNVPKNLWDRYEVEGKIQLIKIPTVDGLFVDGGISTSEGNLDFDYGLLSFELLMVIVGVFRFVRLERVKAYKNTSFKQDFDSKN